MKLYQELSLLIQHLTLPGFNPLHVPQHARLNELINRFLAPVATNVQIQIKLDKCSKNYIVFEVMYNHQGDVDSNDNMTIDDDLWTTHKVIVEPSFVSTLDITVKGPRSHQAYAKVEKYLRTQLMIEGTLTSSQFDEIFGKN